VKPRWGFGIDLSIAYPGCAAGTATLGCIRLPLCGNFKAMHAGDALRYKSKHAALSTLCGGERDCLTVTKQLFHLETLDHLVEALFGGIDGGLGAVEFQK
jgi:hypothetical protein